MSNYTIAVSWSGKDALADSDANKVISGADFNTEFTAVQSAVNTKADLAGSATQAFSATTASVGTNTTQVASTAFVTAAITAVQTVLYPVGSIYFNAAVATNPGTLLGFGTWAAYGGGRVMVGVHSSGTFDGLNETGGAETHTLSTSEMPAHTHSIAPGITGDGGATGSVGVRVTHSANNTGSTGGGGAHNNIQPYITVYMWKRTA